MPAVWAYSTAAPGKTCADARLGGGTKLEYPGGNEKGQAGWDVGLMFTKFSDLADKLKEVRRANGAITRLAVNLHGMPGKIDADSLGTEAGAYDFEKLWKVYSQQLQAINGLLADGAVVLIMGCNVAAGDFGAKFLSEMSQKAFPGHKVVGFTTTGITLKQFRAGEGCTEPGLRDSPYDRESATATIRDEREKELLSLPWVSETSPHAKAALAGKIVSGAEASTAADYSPDSYMPGSWSVTIGDWNGYFVFSRDKTAYWMDSTMHRHPGKWWTEAGGVRWSYSDDPPGWTRVFEVATPLKSTVSGKATIKGVDHGFFTMSKQ